MKYKLAYGLCYSDLILLKIGKIQKSPESWCSIPFGFLLKVTVWFSFSSVLHYIRYSVILMLSDGSAKCSIRFDRAGRLFISHKYVISLHTGIDRVLTNSAK